MTNAKQWTVTVEEDKDNLILPLPNDMLDELGWKIDDTIEWFYHDDGTLGIRKPSSLYPGDNERSVIEKAKMENVELDLNKDELHQLMLMAHENDITLNQMVERILIDLINRHKNANEV